MTARRIRVGSLFAVVAMSACQGDPNLPVFDEVELHTRALTTSDIDSNLTFAQQQVLKAENRLGNSAHPRYTPTDFTGGQWSTSDRTDWRSGFFNGTEWLLFENFGANSNNWQSKADARTRDFASETTRPQTHDVGFKTLTTYGNAFRLTNLEEFRPKIFEGANTLAARYLPQYGVTRSWDDTNGDVRVIVDNMMNLEVFFLAAELTTNSADRDGWLSKAISHAKKTEQNQIRDSADPNIDGSTCHVYFYNLNVCRTHQGLSDTSTWVRGQAWVMYGFTMAYQYARKYPQYAAYATLFLATAQRTTDLYLRRLAELKHGDKVPLHDFDAPAGNPKDSSAAAIAASAMLELSRIPAVSAGKRAEYKLAAEQTLDILRLTTGTQPYRTSSTASDTSKETILLRATTTYRGAGNSANRDVERGLSYADYYFVEALLRHKDMYGTAPKAPGFLAASAAPGGVTLTWKATRGAASYTIKRGTASGGPYTALATVNDPGHLDSTAVMGTPYYYVVTATNQVPIESAHSNQVSATVPDPDAFVAGDIGSVGATGSTSVSGGTLTIKGAGADIWNTADGFHFYRRPVTGNVTVIARVASIQNTNATAKAGLMIREDLTPGSKNVLAYLSPTASNAYRFQYRTTAGGTTSRNGQLGPGTAPQWFRVVRSGNVFTASYSADGVSWSDVAAPVTVTMGATVYVGLAVTSHVAGTLNTSTFTNFSVGP